MMLRKVGYFALVGLFGASLVANAQNRVLVQEVPQDQIQAAPAQPTTIHVNTAQAAQQANQQPVYILQAPAVQAQQQAPTTVEAAPVRESKAEVLRRQREEIERQTEDKMVQRIEDDRLNSEKERADRLFNVQAAPTPAPVAPVVVAPAPAVVVAPAPVQVVEPAPVIAPVSQSVTAEVEKASTEQAAEKNLVTVGGVVGVGQYPTVSNISGIYSLGASVGLVFPSRWGIEGLINYSSYDVQVIPPNYMQPPIVRMDQWNFTSALTYRFKFGSIQPVLGALLGYTYRTYEDAYPYGGYQSPAASSNAFDLGFLLGIDVKLTEKFFVGSDFRYMNNISYRTERPYAYSGTYGKPIESLNYYIIGVNVKYAF